MIVDLQARIYFVAQLSKCLAYFNRSACAVDGLRWVCLEEKARTEPGFKLVNKAKTKVDVVKELKDP